MRPSTYYVCAAAVAALFLAPARAQDPAASISLVTEPDKATVTCDGILREESPLTISPLRPGTHLISVERSGYLPARRTVTLAAGQRSALVIPLERLTGLVLLQSVPEGAEIELNGASRGKAPLLLTDLVPGSYRVRATAPGFLGRNVEFEVKDRIPQKVVVSLASDSATLTLRSQPVGATVQVNGLTKGVTPCTLDRLPAGDAEVVVSLPDFETYRSTVKLQANEEQALDITLKAVPSAVSVISTPTGARIFVDDVLKGQAPVTLDALPAGSHVVRAEMEGYEPSSRTIELRAAQKSVEEFQLSANVGRLELMVKPDGVQVAVDGADKGVIMPGAEGTVGQLAFELPVGDHKVVLTLKGYGTVEKRIAIQKGQTASVKEVLRRTFVADTQVKLNTGEVVTGVKGERLPNDDLKLETQLGIYKTIKAADIVSIESLKPATR